MNTSTFDKIIESGNIDLFFRITYNDIGIYEAYRQNVSQEKWKKFLNSKEAKWLPKPHLYNSNNKLQSYFTKLGYEMFMQYTYDIFKKDLNENDIIIEQVYLDEKSIVYKDKHQVVITI